MKILDNCYKAISSPENLWAAWLKYRQGKQNRQAVREFEAKLENNLVELRETLLKENYCHDGYYKFVVHDPKKRMISVPSVKDHLVHRAVFNILYPFFDSCFSPFSFSCRDNKGTLKAVDLLSKYLRQTSGNYCRDCWVLHGDIKKCFDSINHEILFNLLGKRIKCFKTLSLLKNIIKSYQISEGRGIPLGNLTSQLFINIYLNELDCFVKEKLRVKKYLRYADDFLLVFETKKEALSAAEDIRFFLKKQLQLDFPLDHQEIKALRNGFEVLGQRFLPFYRRIRGGTFHRLSEKVLSRAEKYLFESNGFDLNASWQSAAGMLKHGNNFNKKKEVFLSLNKSYVR
jgi:retron-type reverse transcriptase